MICSWTIHRVTEVKQIKKPPIRALRLTPIVLAKPSRAGRVGRAQPGSARQELARARQPNAT